MAVPVAGQSVKDSIITPAGDSLSTIDNDSTINNGVSTDTSIAGQTIDSIYILPVVNMGAKWKDDPSIPLSVQILNHHPFFNFNTQPTAVHIQRKEFEGKEALFYVLSALLLFFSLLRLLFAKYYNDLFRVFFRTTLKQRQIKEQLMQTPLPSLGFNIFFIASAGLYLDFLFYHFKINPLENFWLLYAYCCAGLSLIYFIKFICLKVCGWLFNMKNAAEAYVFIVFIINKIIGIFLLPVLIVLAFMGEPVISVAFILSWCGIGILFLYRFILGYTAIRKEVRFNLFHFFLYLCAFEIAPLLLIYRLLLLVF